VLPARPDLWDRERLIFTPGDAPPPVLTTRFGRIGVLICYDLEFPEMPRSLARGQSAGSYSQPGSTNTVQATTGAMMIMLMPHCSSRR
jgi:predicted amidohydrolase